ncbi:PAP2 superfamily protein, partial [Streptomyces sp. di50b]
ALGHGFVDTMAQYSSWGWWGGEASAPRGLGGMTNQYAAMPSLHVGWALWCGVILWKYGRGRWARTAAVGYPLVTTIVVMGTANHYFLDALAGAAVMGAGYLLAPYVTRCANVVKARFRVGATAVPAASSGSDAAIVSDGCQTSAGERIPRQRQPESRYEAEPGATLTDAGEEARAPAR